MNNKEICQFINSKDIRQYLLDTNYNFTSTETAWLVYQCKRATLGDKLKAWNDILQTMPDDVTNSRHGRNKYQHIHELLTDYIAMKNKMIAMFMDNTSKSFYQYAAIYGLSTTYDDSIAYSAYDSCYRQLLITFKEDEELSYGEIRRQEIDSWLPITATYNRNGEMMDITIHSDYGLFDWNLTDFFDDLWFHFPTPFKAGDILYNPDRAEPGYCTGPVVMRGITPLRYEKDGNRGSDISDMNVWGYFLNHDTYEIYDEVTWNYMDFEYYPENLLIGPNRILKALSNYKKKEISIDLFTSAYQTIALEEMKNRIFNPGMYLADACVLAGLNGGTGND